MTRYDAVVVGAGVAGSTCAILLAEAGWSVALVEKQRFPRRKVCGECVAASNLALIDRLGIGAQFDALAGPPLRVVAFCAGENMVRAALPSLAPGRHPWGRALGREHLDDLLLNRALAAGADIFQPSTIHEVASTVGMHRCTVIDANHFSRTIDTPILIDAQGSWQRGVGLGQNRRTRKKPTDLLAFKANFSSARLANGVLPVLAFRGGYGGMVQGDHGLLTLACCVRRDRLHIWRKRFPGVNAGEAVRMALEAEIAAVRDALHGARREGAWLSIGPIRPQLRKTTSGNGLFAVGNAAGEAHPILGEGISMAIQSAFLLSRQLIERDESGVRYDIARQRAFAGRIMFAAIYAQIAMRPVPTWLLMKMLSILPSLLSLGAKWGGKVRCAVAPEP